MLCPAVPWPSHLVHPFVALLGGVRVPRVSSADDGAGTTGTETNGYSSNGRNNISHDVEKPRFGQEHSAPIETVLPIDALRLASPPIKSRRSWNIKTTKIVSILHPTQRDSECRSLDKQLRLVVLQSLIAARRAPVWRAGFPCFPVFLSPPAVRCVLPLRSAVMPLDCACGGREGE